MKFPSLPQKGKPVQDTMREVITYLRSARITHVKGGRLKSSPNGTTITIVPGDRPITSGATPGAFYRTRTVASEDATNGDIYLQGGTVSGLATPVPDILIYDASATAWQGTAGQNLQLKVTVDGSESSGIPNPGVTPTGTPVVTSETTLGTNTYPAGTGDMTGKLCHISLGVFSAGGFAPAASGNINIGWCFSNAYTITRE